MIKDRLVIIERLFKSYKGWYDVLPGDLDSGLPLKALCVYRSRSEKYVLSKKAKLWAVEVNDYLYLFSMQKLDVFQAKECIAFAIENALPRVQPHKEHMYSFVTTVFVADEAEQDALKFIRRHRFIKSYRFGFYGSSPLKTLALDIGSEKIVTNNMGRDLRKQIRNIIKE
ncbi:MAG: hypothetical protein FWG99_09140 [Treponema sp.]|nr:hypothetical protein [Treponema sp.]